MKQKFHIEDGKVMDNCNLPEKHAKAIHDKKGIVDEIENDLLENELHGAAAI
jgi:hypothetical protein